MDAEGRVSYNCCAKVDLALVVSLCLILHDRQESHRSSGAGAGAGGEGAYVLLSLSSIMSL